MTLTLQIENFHVLDDGGPVSILVPETGIQVGRRSGMDWVLPDASRYISGHHFDVSFDGGKWSLLDRSTNAPFFKAIVTGWTGRIRLPMATDFRSGNM